jgi:hypothetical protein
VTSAATHRRPGLTLTEVLVAMFVMALGLISLLTLFPLGALQIGSALRDDRCAQTALQADAFLRSYWQARVAEPLAPGAPPAVLAQLDPFIWAMDDPNLMSRKLPNISGVPDGVGTNTYLSNTFDIIPSTATAPNQQIPPSADTTSMASPVFISPTRLVNDVYHQAGNSSGVHGSLPGLGANEYYVTPGTPAQGWSYPVFVDPINVLAKGGTGDANWVGYKSAGNPTASPLLVPRRNLKVTTGTSAAIQTCSLLDDLTFDTNGTPLATGSTITRDGRYNWAAVVQRTSNDRRTVANLTILVFDGRPPLLNLPDTEVVPTSVANIAPGDRSISSVVMPAPTDPNALPVVRRGGWVFDGTLTTTTPVLHHGNFYRIVGVNETAANTYTLDIDPPIRARSDGQTGAFAPTLYFFAGLAEVFVRPPLVPNPTPGQ